MAATAATTNIVMLLSIGARLQDTQQCARGIPCQGQCAAGVQLIRLPLHLHDA